MSDSNNRASPGSVPPPSATALYEAALNYLARYTATEIGVRRVLERRINRWSRAAKAAAEDREAVDAQAAQIRHWIADVVARLVSAGALSDTEFAESRARSLARAGRSQRSVIATLAAKGVRMETLRQVLPEVDGEAELAAALVLARRRRVGPFRAGQPPDETERRRELAVFARAGFSQSVAQRAVDTDPVEANARVHDFRR